MLGLDARSPGSVIAVPPATRDRFLAWSPFRPKAARPSSLTVSLATLVGGAVGAGAQDSPIPAPQSYAQLERKYGTSAPVYVCVRRKARDLASAPLRVMIEQADGTRRPADKDDELAALLRNPNPWITGAQLVYFCSMFLDLTGNFFLLILRDRKGRPRQLYPVNPIAVTIYGSPGAPVSSYELLHYGKTQPLEAYGPGRLGEMLHFRLGSPVPQAGTWGSAFPSPWGFGPLEAMWDLVVTDGDATRWNRNLVKNDAQPRGYLKTEQPVNEGTVTEAKERWARNYGGPDNAGAVAVLGSGMSYQQLSLSPKDMDYLPASKELWRRIIAGFDLNSTVLGFTEGDVGRRDEQVKDYWNGTIIATSQTDVCPTFAPLAAEFGERYVVEQDFSKVRALSANWQQIGSSVGMCLDRGMPMKVANDVFELDVPEYPGWDVGYVSLGVVAIDPETGEPKKDPEPPPAPGDEPPLGDEPPPAPGKPPAPGRPPASEDETPDDVEKALSLVEARVERAARRALRASR